MAAAAHSATIHEPRWAGVARKLGEAGVIALGFEFGADGGVFLYRLSFGLLRSVHEVLAISI